ncbi:MAG: CapA family protein [Treponema sp.]|nr:CapA family protein [Treponema sp.]
MRKTFLTVISVLLLFSCTSTKVETADVKSTSPDNLNIVICGDIMCHTQNFKTRDFSLIWDGIKDITLNSDLTIANVEAPVCDDRPFENYPNFNMQPSYPQAAIDAGVNLITVANNHTNDQGVNGIISTAQWINSVHENYQGTDRPVYINGLKQDVSTAKKASQSPVTFNCFKIKNYDVIFLGITQILNTSTANERINYFPFNEKGNNELKDLVIKLKQENPCDLFILAVHTDEPEYILDIFEDHRNFYLELLDAGVDILWSNHPHVVKPAEYFADSKTKKIKKVILYSTGNTISGQRSRPNYENPTAIRDYTGDGFLVTLNLKKTPKGIYITNHKRDYITTFIDKERNYLIKRMSPEFYEYLVTNGYESWEPYLRSREKALDDVKDIITWQ